MIHFYPRTTTKVSIELALDGTWLGQYPRSQDGRWALMASPSGELFDPKSEKRYTHLSWNGSMREPFAIDPRRAHCVRSDDAENFLEQTCHTLSFSERERTDFVSRFLAPIAKNPFSLVQFLDDDEIGAYARLSITPRPDTLIRLFMIFARAPDALVTGAPALVARRRAGFTVVEWAGVNLDDVV